MSRMSRRLSAPLLALAFLGVSCNDTEETTSQSAALGQNTSAPSRGKRVRGQKDPDAMNHPTGRRELTPEEKQKRDTRLRSLKEVRPTPLALDRLRQHIARHPDRTAGVAEKIAGLQSQLAAPGADLATAPAALAGAGTTLAAGELPLAIDNSTLPGFPEIRSQGGIGSCVAFSVAYYQYTHELSLLTGWNNKNGVDTTKISPKWAYNLTNNGNDIGTYAESVYDVIEEHGALTWADFPYSGDATMPVAYREWPRGAAKWTKALRYKGVEHGTVGVPTDPTSMRAVKNLLLNGHVLSFSTWVYGWVYDQLDNDPATTADDGFFTNPDSIEQIATWVDGSSGPHEMTIVGYNDDLWVDINGNGLVEASEKGAFKIANSWGNTWQNAGFVWLAYDALNNVTTVPGGPSGSTRRRAIDEIFWVTARADYQPTVLAEVTLSTTQRGSLWMTVGVTELDRTTPFLTFYPGAFRSVGGSFAWDGTTTTQPQTASFAIDLSGVAQSHGDVRYQINESNSGQIAATLSGFTIVDLLSNTRTVTADPTATVNFNENKTQTVRYRFVDPAHVPQLVVGPTNLAFGNVPLGSSDSRGLTLQNTGTGTVFVSSLRFDKPLFGSKDIVPVTLQPGETKYVNVSFAPVGNQSETGTLSVRSNNAAAASIGIPLTGAGTSTNDAAPFLLYIRQQNGLTDNSIATRIELVSHAPMPARISDYKIVYYINEPGRDITQLVWDTWWTNTRTPIGFKARKLFMTKTAGPRTADTAIELTFPEGTTIYPNETIIIDGALHHRDWLWTFDENDDWSRYLRRDQMAENAVVQSVQSKGILFGSSPEGTLSSQYHMALATPTPVTGDATITFDIDNPALVPSLQAIELWKDGVFFTYFRYSVSAVGPQSFVLPTSYYPAGQYAVVLRINAQTVDYVEFQKI